MTSFGSNVYIPAHIADQVRKYNKNIKQEESNMTDEEIMTELKVNKGGLARVRMAQTIVLSLSEAKFISKSGKEKSVEDAIPDHSIKPIEIQLEEKDTKELIESQLAELDPLSVDILTRRYLSDTKENLKSIGQLHKMTGERIRQIEYKALKLLRRRMKSRAFSNI